MRFRREELKAALLGLGAAFVALSLFSFDIHDLPFYVSSPDETPSNVTGIIGAYFSGILFFLFGKSAYFLPVLMLFWAAGLLLVEEHNKISTKAFSTILFLITSGALFSAGAYPVATDMHARGGLTGFLIFNTFVRYFGHLGLYFILLTITGLSFFIATEFLVFPLILFFFKCLTRAIGFARDFFEKKSYPDIPPEPKRRVINPYRSKITSSPKSKEKDEPHVKTSESLSGKREKAPPIIKVVAKPIARPQKKELEREKVVTTIPESVIKTKTAEEKKPNDAGESGGHCQNAPYQLPQVSFLNDPPMTSTHRTKDSLEASSKALEETLRDFGVDVKVVKVDQGPVITRYELEPASGVKVSKITTLSDDIALAMKAESVRIIAPIPGKAAVGVEVPNTAGATVYMREIITSSEFKMTSSNLAIALGKTVSGKPVIADLADMPHLLIAGTTGAGKTVCVNVIITSILYHAKPGDVKFIMIDPKMVELATYNSIPHLLTPVVTDPKKAAGALFWAVSEMENRYKMLAKIGVRNIIAFNKKIAAEGREDFQKLPYIVVIIDELADLMLVAQNEVENSIARLAQMSRAVGIHIILATQRPSVDVITGVIKANFPARISFKVATKIDSRTVLDAMGAEKLLGKGDMLFMKPGREKPMRIQGALLADAEIERIIRYVTQISKPEFNEEIVTAQKRNTTQGELEKDECYDEAVQIVLNARQASISILQRRLKLGYQRAARIIDFMEAEGIIGPHQGPKSREILVEDDQINEYLSGEEEEEPS